MQFNMITTRHNFDAGYISLVNINLSRLPETIDIGRYTLLRKNEFHISLLCLKQLDEILDPDTVEAKKEVIKKTFLDFEKTHHLIDFELSGEYRLVKRGDRVTIVAMATVKYLEELFNEIRARTNLDFPTQPAHITIYTLQPEAGIGLTSQEQVEKESEKIDIPILYDLRVG